MTDTSYCPQCGSILPPNAPFGICPGCLFKGVLESHGSMTGEGLSEDGFGDSPPAPHELASDFPDLEILRLVGRGGMGIVYQARQKHLDRVVALKILSPKIASDPAFAERFSREARMMALLTHPHVVNVYEFGTTSSVAGDLTGMPLYYLLMEFVDGPTLRQLIDNGQVTAPQAMAIVPQICEALQFAHDKGVVHRDIKPENILLDRQGNVKIADFGLAKLMGLRGHDISISTTGQVLGTLHYMAPEQLERPLEVDHRADIYSLGVVFYQLLTGELPLGRFVPPSRKVVVDVRLDEVVMRALEKEPSLRYQQVSALQDQVESIATTSSGTRPDNWWSTFRPQVWWRTMRSRPWTSLIGVISVVVCAIVVVNLQVRIPSNHESRTSLAESPHNLRSAPTARVIETGLEKPLSPWAWQELERRTLTASDANIIIDGLTAWIRREYPQGMLDPFPWLDPFLDTLDRRGLVVEPQKIAFLEALQGEVHGDRIRRLREGTRVLSLNLGWRRIWDRDLFGLLLVNEVQSVTADGQQISLTAETSRGHWNSDEFNGAIQLPALTLGKHLVHFEILSALVSRRDLEGLDYNATSSDWPPAKKRWTRGFDLEVVVFPADRAIVATTSDPSLDPTSHGLKLDPIIVRRSAGQKQAVLKIDLSNKSLPVPISFDVAMIVDGKSISCGSFWATTNVRSESLKPTIIIPGIGSDIVAADVVMTPNPKWIELQPGVDQIWGEEVVFRNIPLRRLDIGDSPPPN